MRKITKRSAAVIAAAVIAVGGAGAAWAAWTSSGTADVAATAGSAAPLTVDTTSVSGTLVPGTPGSVVFKVTNGNTYPVTINGLSLGDFTSTKRTCDALSTFEQASPAPFPAAFSTPLAAGTSQTYTWANSIKLTADPDDDCQGAPFSFKLTASAVSAAS